MIEKDEKYGADAEDTNPQRATALRTTVSTPYGDGTFLRRMSSSSDGTARVVVQLSFGRLYCHEPSSPLPPSFSSSDKPCTSTKEGGGASSNSSNVDDDVNSRSSNASSTMMDMQVAYHALETMRKCNVQVAASSPSLGTDENVVDPFVLDKCCTACLMDSICSNKNNKKHSSASNILKNAAANLNFSGIAVPSPPLSMVPPCLRHHFERNNGASGGDGEVAGDDDDDIDETKDDESMSENKHNNDGKRRSQNNNNNSSNYRHLPSGIPCLACGTPVCRRHSSTARRFRGSSATTAVCLDCEPLLDVESVVHRLTYLSLDHRRAFVNRLLDCYDRLLLLLGCFEPVLDGLACHLVQNEEQERSKDKSAYCQFEEIAHALVDWILPVTSSGVGSSGSCTHSHGFMSTALADWILALYTLTETILCVTGTALTRAHILRMEHAHNEEWKPSRLHVAVADQREKAPWNRRRNSSSCDRVGTFITDGRRQDLMHPNASTSTTSVLFGGLFKSNAASSSAEKAVALRKLRADLSTFPSTSSVAEGCQVVLTSLADHEHALKAKAISRFLSALHELSCFEQSATTFLASQCERHDESESSTGYDYDDLYCSGTYGTSAAAASALSPNEIDDSSSSSFSKNMSLIDRIELYRMRRQRRESSTSSVSSSASASSVLSDIVADPIFPATDDESPRVGGGRTSGYLVHTLEKRTRNCHRSHREHSVTSSTAMIFSDVFSSSSSSLAASSSCSSSISYGDDCDVAPVAATTTTTKKKNKRHYGTSLLRRIALHKQREEKKRGAGNVVVDAALASSSIEHL